MKQLAALLALALASLALVACGGGDSETSETTGGGGGEGSGGGSTLAFEADPGGQLAFTTSSATTKAGNVTIEFTNPQALPHDVKIEDSGGSEVGGTDTITEGSNSATVTLKPGSYTFYCSVPGHREAGMEGTLTVK
jgi:plastocyanin